MTTTKRRYPISAWFSSESPCDRHRAFGAIPCPWPNCENGVPGDAIYQEGLGAEPEETKFLRVEWPFDTESGFSWKRADTPAVLEARRMAGSEAVRRFPTLSKAVGWLYHYTDVTGLMGIVHEGGLWLTDARYMNDRSEVEHGIKIAAGVLKAVLDDPVYAPTADRLRETVYRLQNTTRPRVCVASFCEDGDNLSQWRAYGSNGSRVALGFDPLGGSFRALTECHLRRVVYDQQLQRDWLRMAVHFHHVGLQHDRAISPGRKREYVEKYFSEILYSALYDLAVCFKDKAFIDEREWRFVYNENWPEDMVEMLRTKTYYRVRGRMIVPYVTMSDLVSKDAPKSILPLQEVVVGPQPEADLVARGIGEFLKNEGYDHIVVRLSQTSFRPNL